MNRERDLAVLFSDWHVHKFKAFAENDERLQWSLKVLKDLGDFCKSNGITKILFGGDLYHTQGVLLTEVINSVVEDFTIFFELNPEITFYAISGNHDHASKNLYHKPAITALSHLARIFPNNFILFDNASVQVNDGVIFHGIPYYSHKEDFDKKLQELHDYIVENYKDAGYDHHLMIHQTPRMIQNSMIPYDTDPEDAKYKIFQRVWCGHIHVNMDLAENFTLIGNPNHNDLADAGKQKGFLLTNLNNPAKGYKFIHLQGYPEFIKAKDGDILEEGLEENNYIVRTPDMTMIKTTEQANIEDFNTSLESSKIMENFWVEVTQGADKELLKVGLSFL